MAKSIYHVNTAKAMSEDPIIECVLLQAIRDEILQILPDKRCYYHYNPSAANKGPMLYFNWCSDYDHHWNGLWNHEVQILIYDGKIYIVKDRQPSPCPINIIESFDLSEPSFYIDNLVKVLRKYYAKESSGTNKWHAAMSVVD